jgi:hypothetical protein
MPRHLHRRLSVPYQAEPRVGFDASLKIKILSGVLHLPCGIPDSLPAWQFGSLSSVIIHMKQEDLHNLGQNPSDGGIVKYARRFLARERHTELYVEAKDDRSYQIRFIPPRLSPTNHARPPFYPASPITHLTISLDGDDWASHTLEFEHRLSEAPMFSQMWQAVEDRRALGEAPAPYLHGCWGRD